MNTRTTESSISHDASPSPGTPGEGGGEGTTGNAQALLRTTGRGDKISGGSDLHTRRRGGLICLLIILLAMAAYWPATHAEFVSWDDYKVVRDNPVLDSPSWQGFIHRWTQPYLLMYMPLTQSFYQTVAPLARLPGETGHAELNPWVYHWSVILLRLLDIPIVFVLLRRIVGNEWAAGVGTALLALHPITVESVAWISEASMPLAMLLTAGCLWQWLVFRQSSRHRAWHAGAATLLYILALLSKPACVTIPLMAWALDVWVARVNWKKSILHLLPWVVLAIPLALYTRNLQPPGSHDVWAPPVWQRPAVAADAIVFYLGKILVPRHFMMDYGRTPQWTLSQPFILATDGLAILLLVWAGWRLRHKRPKWIAGGIIFFAGLLPVLGLTPFAFQVYSTVADRYAFLPMLGLAIFVAVLFANIRKIGPWLIAVAVLVFLGCLTFQQTDVWHDNYSLYERTRQLNPNSWVAWDNLANTYIADNKPIRAMPLARQAWWMRPEQNDVAINMGVSLAMLNRPAQAVPFLQRVMRSHPDDHITSMNLGAAYVKLRQYDLGIKWLKYSQKLDPTSQKVANLLNGAIQLRDYLKTRNDREKNPNQTQRR